MSLPRFFLDKQVIGNEAESPFALRLSDSDLKHARALRLKPEEHFAVIDATGDYFECAVVSFTPEGLSAKITAKAEREDLRPTIVLVQGIAKGEKMDTVIRQGTEIGVGGFIPFACERSVVRLDAKKAEAKTDRWRAIARSAAMQSGQLAVPEVSFPKSISEVCDFVAQANAVVVCWEEEHARSIKELIADSLSKQQVKPEDARVVVVVGPEGGLAQQEVAALAAANRYSATVTLGPSILRAETAGVLAPALVLYELGGIR